MVTRTRNERELELQDALFHAAEEVRVKKTLEMLKDLRKQGVLRSIYNLESPYGYGVTRHKTDPL